MLREAARMRCKDGKERIRIRPSDRKMPVRSIPRSSDNSRCAYRPPKVNAKFDTSRTTASKQLPDANSSSLIPRRSFAAFIGSITDAGVEVRLLNAQLRGTRSRRPLRLLKLVLNQRWRGMSHRWCRRRVSDRSGWRGPRVIPARSYILLGGSGKQKDGEERA